MIDHDRRGPGADRLYLHGLGSTGEAAFGAVVHHTARGGGAALAPDLLGHGRFVDVDPARDLSLAAQADHVADILDAHDVRRVDVIAHSMGGSVALLLAHRRPDLVQRLVLVEPNLDPWDGAASVWIARQGVDEFVRRGFSLLCAQAAPTWSTTLQLMRPEVLHQCATALAEFGSPTGREVLLGLAGSATVVWGRESALPSDVEAIEAAGVPFISVPGGHTSMSDDLEAFVAAVERVLHEAALESGEPIAPPAHAPLALRRATVNDAGAVLEFWSRAAENGHRPTDSAEAVASLVRRDPEALRLAVQTDAAGRDQIVGTLVTGWDGWRAHLYRLAVEPSQRGRGIARLLLDDAEQRLRGLGATRIDAMVLAENALARPVWSAVGFEEQEEWRRWVRPLDDSRGTSPVGAEVSPGA